jgi:hypothetical protein
MKAVPHSDPLEIEVTDFGPIVHGKVDLRPLTVFVGPSNTGKSYLAILLYALHRCFSAGAWPGHWRFSRGPHMFRNEGRRQLTGKTINALALLAQQWVADEKQLPVGRSMALSGPVADEIRSIFDAQGDQLNNEVSRCFGIGGTGGLIRKGTNDCARIIFRRPFSDDSAPAEHLLTIGKRGTTFKAAIPEDASIQIGAGWGGRNIDYLRYTVENMVSTADEGDKERNLHAWQLIEVLAGFFALRHVVGPLRFPAFYLPADRTGVMHAHSAVVSAMIGNAPMTGLRPTTHTPMLSGVLADFLQQLIELDDPLFQPGKPPRDLGRKIEQAILEGSVHVNRSDVTGYPRFTYRPEGWKDDLPLMNTSSMVSELAPVVLYLRHMVGPDNLLIVEEPESHLHPAMQVEFTRQLAMLVRSGVRVIVTTHSEWVLEELANIVRRSALPEAGRKDAENADVALSPSDVGAWLFKPKRRPKGSVVEEVKLDEETGLYPTDYDAVSEALYNESASIFNRIQDSNPR